MNCGENLRAGSGAALENARMDPGIRLVCADINPDVKLNSAQQQGILQAFSRYIRLLSILEIISGQGEFLSLANRVVINTTQLRIHFS
jgi:hypothetical protein